MSPVDLRNSIQTRGLLKEPFAQTYPIFFGKEAKSVNYSLRP